MFAKNDYQPTKVAGRYGVVVRGADGHGVWDVAEIVTLTGHWITLGYAFDTKAEAMAAAWALVEGRPVLAGSK